MTRYAYELGRPLYQYPTLRAGPILCDAARAGCGIVIASRLLRLNDYRYVGAATNGR
jgi:hypothetical protein